MNGRFHFDTMCRREDVASQETGLSVYAIHLRELGYGHVSGHDTTALLHAGIPGPATSLYSAEGQAFFMDSRFLMTLLVVPLLAGRAYAQVDRADSVAVGADSMVVALGGVTVEGRRLTNGAVPMHLLLRGAGVSDLGAVIGQMGGRDIRRHGATGSASLALRGMPAAHTLILLDGIPLVHPQTGQVDLSLIPLLGLESASIVSGPGDGEGGLGGRLYLNARQGRESVSAQASAGAWGERVYGTRVQLEQRGRSAMVAWQGSSWPADFPFTDQYVLDAGDGSGSARRRTGAGKTAQSLMVGLSDDARVRTEVLGWWTTSTRGLPGPANSTSLGAWQTDAMYRVQASLDMQVSTILLDLSGAWTQHALAFRSPREQSDLSAATWYARARASLVKESTSLRLAVSPDITFEETTAGQHAADRTRRTVEPGVIMNLTSSRFATSVHVRAVSASGEPIRLASGVNVAFDAARGLRLRGGLGRSVRIPTFNELYWIPGGNPALRPERGWTGELGLDVDTPVGRAGLTVFGSDLHDRILWRPMFAGAGIQVFHPENTGRVVSGGVEWDVSGGARVGRVHTGWRLHGTRVRATDRTDPRAPSHGHQLRYTPTSSVGAGMSGTTGQWTLDVSARHTGRRFITSDETQWLDAYVTMDMAVHHAIALPSVTLQVWLKLNNATDARWDSMRLYPMPPRHLQGGLTIQTNPTE